MGLTFEPFRIWIIKHRPTAKKRDIARECEISDVTMTKIWNDRLHLNTLVIEKICSTYNLDVKDVIAYRSKSQSETD